MITFTLGRKTTTTQRLCKVTTGLEDMGFWEFFFGMDGENIPFRISIGSIQ